MNKKPSHRHFLPFFLIAMMAFISSAFAGESKTGPYTPNQALSFSQAAIGRTLANYALVDDQGRTVNMVDFRGKPLVVSFIYSSCIDSCPVITQTLADAVRVARDALGENSFSVLSIGFDSSADSPDQMREFAIQQDIDVLGWKFLSGDLPTILGFSESLGFAFTPSSDGFEHLSQVTVIGQNGVVYRQVYGDNFETPMLVEPLKELVFGTPAPFASLGELIKKVRLFCTIYDPATERYRFDYSIFIQLIVGFLIVGGMAVFVTREWWRIWGARNKRTGQQPPRHRSV